MQTKQATGKINLLYAFLFCNYIAYKYFTRCECPEGYKGINCSEKINYCLPNPCLNNGSCIQNLTKYTCNCQKIYYGTNCEKQMSGHYNLKFSKLSTTQYIKMVGASNNLTEFTVCFWIQTTDKFNYGTILSYATAFYDNALTITDYTGYVLNVIIFIIVQ